MAAIAQWIRLRLPSCGPGFESQAQHLHFAFFNLNLNRNVERTKKRPGLAHSGSNRAKDHSSEKELGWVVYLNPVSV